MLANTAVALRRREIQDINPFKLKFIFYFLKHLNTLRISKSLFSLEVLPSGGIQPKFCNVF